jgi:hypothetical protein
LDLKPTTDDKQRFKPNILPGEADVLGECVGKNSYKQPQLLNAKYNANQRVQEIMMHGMSATAYCRGKK